MKKLLLLIGLVVFLTPMVVSANSLEEELAYESTLPDCNIKNNNIISSDACFAKDFGLSKSYTGEFKNYQRNGYGIDTKEKYSGFWKDDLWHGEGILEKNDGIYSGGFDNGLFYGDGKFIYNDGIILDGYWRFNSLINGKIYYQDTFIAKIDETGLITYFDENTEIAKDQNWGFKYDDMDQIKRFKKSINLSLDFVENDLLNEKCIMDPEYHNDFCFCKRPDDTYYKLSSSSSSNVFDVCGTNKYGNIQVTLKEALDGGLNFNYDKSWVSADNKEYIYCKRLDLAGDFDFISAFPARYNKCPDNLSGVEYTKVSKDEYLQSWNERLSNEINWENTFKEYNIQRTSREVVCVKRGIKVKTRLDKCINKSLRRASFNSLARALGCGNKSKDADECVKRWLPSVVGSGVINDKELEQLKSSTDIMGEIVWGIKQTELAAAQTNVERQPTEEEIAVAKQQSNASSNPRWEYTSTGIGYWNYGNGFGWAPPNPIHDKIVGGLSISWQAKRNLQIGGGRTIFFAPKF